MKKRFGPLVRGHNTEKISSSSSSSSSSSLISSAVDTSDIPEAASMASPLPPVAEEEAPVEYTAALECEEEETYSSGSLEGDMFREADLECELTFRSWYRIWTWLRQSETMCILKKRIDKLSQVYTSDRARSYLDFLYSTASTWVVCCFTWSFTLGYQSTAMQEGIHWSLKSRLGKKKVELHKVIDFFRDVMKTRRLTRERLTHAGTLSQLHTRAAKSGCSSFSESIKVYLTLEGQQDTLRRLNEALDYIVSPLLNETDLRSALVDAEIARQSSARRFSLFIDAAYNIGVHSEDGTVTPIMCNGVGVKFFKVKSRSEECTIDVVAVLGNGSFACTDPTFANMGLPCKHIMAVFLSGDAYLNAGFHYNLEYQMQFVRSMDPLDLMQLSVASTSCEGKSLTEVSIDASSDYAALATEEAWSIVGLGGERFSSVTRLSSRLMKNSKLSAKESLKKEIYWLEPFLANRVDLRIHRYCPSQDGEGI